MSSYDYDYVVIGGGSGGIASAKRAASLYGKRVALIEKARLGGTCVNVGCVPKKICFNAASLADFMRHDAAQYGLKVQCEKVNWPLLKSKRDAYVAKLNGIYANGLDSTNVAKFTGTASLVDAHTVQIVEQENNGDSNTTTITADYILIATGGRPVVLPEPGIAEHCITSDGFFEMETLPETVVVVGAGYIAVELAGVMNALGSKVHLVVRKQMALREFDPDVATHLDAEMQKQGITIHRHAQGVAKVELDTNNSVNNKRMVGVRGAKVELDDVGSKKLTLHLLNGEVITGADEVLMAPGRVPNVENMNLEKVGIKLRPGNAIIVDEYQNTSVPNIFAVGDVCGQVELTPMAVAAGRRLADRIFGGISNAKVSYENVPTVVFSHPTIGTCGLTEPAAIAKYGQDNIKIYKSTFANLYYGIFDTDDKPKTLMKLITAGVEEKVVGMHVIGMGADEMMQGFGVAMKMNCTKADMDSCVAIHPTAAEEFVTMGAWGTSPLVSGAAVSPLMGAKASNPTQMSNSSSNSKM